MQLPPLDHYKSPHTGYTRAHWEAVADAWLGRALGFASPGNSLFRIPGRYSRSGPESDALEGFARSFLIAAPRIAGGGDRLNLAERYASGLRAGTTKGGPEEWLRGVDCVLPLTGKTQPIVEAANIALALHVCREQVWEPLSDTDKAQLIDWLEHHARRTAWANNWVLFTAIVEAFLSSAGVDTSAYRSDESVRWVESWHLGDGWYTDGSRRNIDYYNAWVIHPFLWAWYDMVGRQRDPDAAWRWRQRITAFGRSFPQLFGANGSPMQQGRSLTYRTATLAPLWIGEFSGTSTMTPGAIRRLASGTLRYFVSGGVGVDGPLSLGWHDEYLPLTQHYSGPGSPYFAGMGFMGLALPADHPVWTEPEEPQPSEVADSVVPLPGAGWLLQSTRDDGIVRLLNHGSDHITPGTPEPDPLYIKYAYSTHTAAGHEAAFAAGADNEFAMTLADGSANRRRQILEHRVADSVAVSRSRYRVGEVTTASVVHGRYEVRCHRVDGGPPASVTETGYPVAGDTEIHRACDDGWSWTRNAAGLTSAVIALHGYQRGGRPETFEGASPLGRYGAAPVLHGGEERIYVALHVLTTSSGESGAEIEEWAAAVTADVDGDTVTIHFAGTEPISVHLAVRA